MMSSRKRLESLTLGSELRWYGVTSIPTTKAKCIEELTLHLGEEGLHGNLVKQTLQTQQTHKVGKTLDQPNSANEPTKASTLSIVQASIDEPRNSSASDMLPQLCTLLANQMQQQLQLQQDQEKDTKK